MNNTNRMYVSLNSEELQNINGGIAPLLPVITWKAVALAASALVATAELGERAGKALYHATH